MFLKQKKRRELPLKGSLERREYRFDRKTFNPALGSRDYRILNYLRNSGWTRRLVVANNDRGTPASSRSMYSRALKKALPYIKNGSVFIDLGCGYSPDSLIARRKGATAYKLDLCEVHPWPEDPQFFKRDFCERIPLDAKSVDIVLSQAVIDLVSPEDRILLYKEIKRILKPKGVFVFYICNLNNGWGFDIRQEVSRMLEAGLQQRQLVIA